MSTDTGSAPAEVTPKHKPRRFGVRAIAAGLCLVLATLLLPLGMVGFWGQRTLTDTEQFVQTVGPLGSDPLIVQSIAASVTAALTDSVDLEAEVKKALPPEAAPLAGPIASAIPTFIDQATVQLLSTEQFQQLWTGAVGTLQEAIIKVLGGDNSGAVQEDNGQIVLDLSVVIQEVKTELVANGLTAIENVPIPPAADTQIVLLNDSQVSQARTIYRITVPTAQFFIVFVALLFVAAILFSRRRIRMVGIVGVGVLIGAGLLRALLAIAPDALTNSFIGTPWETSIAVFFDTLTVFLLRSANITVLIGLVLLIVGWVFSGQKYAVALREKVGATKDKPIEPTASV
ncbi:MAG: hypothetical protein HQ526_11895 [Actinobacteria bacterium]|nr:hypothetical protein [Actinomycetota bacterium]